MLSYEKKCLIVVSGVMMLVGVFGYSSRASLAAAFFGANVALGMGWGQEDATKIFLMGLSGALTFIIGLIVAIFAFMKKDGSSEESVGKKA